jgi:hypothetical protein
MQHHVLLHDLTFKQYVRFAVNERIVLISPIESVTRCMASSLQMLQRVNDQFPNNRDGKFIVAMDT